MVIELIGYHGTALENVESIQKDGFRRSEGDAEWLGTGVYFFCEGTTGTNPKNNARKWCIAEASKKNMMNMLL